MESHLVESPFAAYSRLLWGQRVLIGAVMVVTVWFAALAPQRGLSTAVFAVVQGFVVGVLIASALDLRNDSLRSVAEVKRVVRSVPILGEVPLLDGWTEFDEARLIALEKPASPSSDAYDSLRANLQSVIDKRRARCVQISSATGAEGKTVTLANLAVMFTAAGRRVAVVDCDLRRPRLHEFFGRTNRVGFTSVLRGDESLSAALQRVGLPTGAAFHMLTSGPLPEDPVPLLATDRLPEVFAALKAERDLVLVDAPPVLPEAEAVQLAAQVDGVVLVATCNVTGRRDLREAIRSCRTNKTRLLGLVVNGAPR